MDPAEAAEMSDPDRNRQFRRRWAEPHVERHAWSTPASAGALGTLGLALLEAWRRKQKEATASPAGAPR